MKVTTKGQVTIPERIRKLAGIFPGSEVEFQFKGGHLHVKKIGTGPGRGRTLVRKLSGSGTVKMGTDQILALMRG